jgi:hypothetical protein
LLGSLKGTAKMASSPTPKGRLNLASSKDPHPVATRARRNAGAAMTHANRMPEVGMRGWFAVLMRGVEAPGRER